jgi:hypothetical protein
MRNAFDVEFDDGLCILEPHKTIRRANRIAPEAKFKSLQIEDWTSGVFFGPLRQRADRRSLVIVSSRAAT